MENSSRTKYACLVEIRDIAVTLRIETPNDIYEVV